MCIRDSFAPASTESAIARNEARITEINGQVAGLSARETVQHATDTQQQARIDQVSGKVSGLEKSLGDLRATVRRLGMQSAAGAGVLHDSRWLLQQNPKAYTCLLYTSRCV